MSTTVATGHTGEIPMQTAYFDLFTLNMTLPDALSASHQGRCDDDVVILAETGYIAEQLYNIGEDFIRAELRGYGAWDDTELADAALNRHRIVWIAACNIREESKR
jgi:hypothetical protein